MEELLNNYLRFIEEEIDNEKNFDPDLPIQDQFDEILDEMDFRLATVKFEMDVFIDVPRAVVDNTLTLREVVGKIDELPRISKPEGPAFLKKKKGELAKIARQMAADLQSMFG